MTEEKGEVGKGNEKSGSTRNEMSSLSISMFWMLNMYLLSQWLLKPRFYIFNVLSFQMIQ